MGLNILLPALVPFRFISYTIAKELRRQFYKNIAAFGFPAAFYQINLTRKGTGFYIQQLKFTAKLR
ncbi:MAG: hypothetical protein EAZ89_18830 [Bacteroidetes bacterium]|nr:MAG: hypothetical protein EAZ89_18830 [Bacteroidota bacterium]